MTQEEKELLLRDLCARLPYGVHVKDRCELEYVTYTIDYHPFLDACLPYLKPMSSMTKEEEAYYFAINENPVTCIDWLNSHHFDYRGLIEKGLAFKALKEMYV